MKEFSPEDLLMYYYDELTPEESARLERAIAENWPLSKKMEVIREAAERLDRSLEKPRKRAVDSILNYASRKVKAPY